MRKICVKGIFGIKLYSLGNSLSLTLAQQTQFSLSLYIYTIKNPCPRRLSFLHPCCLPLLGPLLRPPFLPSPLPSTLAASLFSAAAAGPHLLLANALTSHVASKPRPKCVPFFSPSLLHELELLGGSTARRLHPKVPINRHRDTQNSTAAAIIFFFNWNLKVFAGNWKFLQQQQQAPLLLDSSLRGIYSNPMVLLLCNSIVFP